MTDPTKIHGDIVEDGLVVGSWSAVLVPSPQQRVTRVDCHLTWHGRGVRFDLYRPLPWNENDVLELPGHVLTRGAAELKEGARK